MLFIRKSAKVEVRNSSEFKRDVGWNGFEFIILRLLNLTDITRYD